MLFDVVCLDVCLLGPHYLFFLLKQSLVRFCNAEFSFLVWILLFYSGVNEGEVVVQVIVYAIVREKRMNIIL